MLFKRKLEMEEEEKKRLIELYDFLDSDMPTKICQDKWMEQNDCIREDMFENHKEIEEYLREHFEIAFPEVFVKENK